VRHSTQGRIQDFSRRGEWGGRVELVPWVFIFIEACPQNVAI